MLFMKSQIFLFIKVALSGREAAERFSISLFLQSNWEPGSGADLFVFSFAMTRRRIPLSLSLTLSLSLSLTLSLLSLSLLEPVFIISYDTISTGVKTNIIL